MNAVSATGALIKEPELRTAPTGEDECRMRLAVPRYSATGIQEPGVVYIEASTFGLRAQEHAERLSLGSRIGFTGRLDRDEWFTERGERRVRYGVLIDQLDYL